MTVGQLHARTDRQADKQAIRQTDRQTGGQTMELSLILEIRLIFILKGQVNGFLFYTSSSL